MLLHELWLNPDEFGLSVENGEVTITGHAGTEAERELLVRRVSLVPGVVSVAVNEVAPL